MPMPLPHANPLDKNEEKRQKSGAVDFMSVSCVFPIFVLSPCPAAQLQPWPWGDFFFFFLMELRLNFDFYKKVKGIKVIFSLLALKI
jgi:hypothetical protein